jgi:hypothetical protein
MGSGNWRWISRGRSADDSLRIPHDDGVVRHVLRDDGSRSDNGSIADPNPFEDDRVVSDPGSIADGNGGAVETFHTKGMTGGPDRIPMPLPKDWIRGVAVVVENVDGLGDKHIVSDFDGRISNQSSAWTQVDAVTEADRSAFLPDSNFTFDYRVRSDLD